MNDANKPELTRKSGLQPAVAAAVALVLGIVIGRMVSTGDDVQPDSGLQTAGSPEEQVATATMSMPDWSGVWAEDGNTVFDHASVVPQGGSVGSRGTREFPPFTDEWEAGYQRNLAAVMNGTFPDPITPCGIPAGFPRIFNLPDVYEFVVRPEETWILSENGPNVMRVYTDGRDHPPADEIWPLYTGDSVGHWEGDTLVFSTISVKNEGSILDRTGLTLSDEMTAVTRMRKLEDGRLEAQMTFTDPLALKTPWVVTSSFKPMPAGTRVYDYACGENNRNPVLENGYTITLGPDGKPLEDVE